MPHRRTPSATIIALSLMTLVTQPFSIGGQEPRRIYVDAKIIEEGGVPPDLESPLLRPVMLAARNDRLYVLDFGDLAIKAFGRDGALLWSRGRRGGGPGEFNNPTDLAIDDAGNIWVADPVSRRVSVFAGSGDLMEEIRTDVSVYRLVVAGERIWAVPTMGAGEFLVLLNRDGGILRALDGPPGFPDVQPMAREPLLAMSLSGDIGALAFRYSDRFYLLDGQALRAGTAPYRVGARGPHRVEQPDLLTSRTSSGASIARVDPAAPEVHVAATADSRDLFFLVGNAGVREEWRNRVVDVFGTRSGEYRYSMVLPEAVIDIEILADGTLAALVFEPVPAIRLWKISADDP